MAEVSAKLVKELRDKTSAGMMDCKKALQEANGNLDEAIAVLRKKGLKNVNKRAGKVASEGVVHTYIHGEGKIGVMLELNCETDFVSRGDDFKDLAHAISMHIAWANPRFLDKDSVPESVLQQEAEIHKSQLKPAQAAMADKIIEGKMKKFFEENCLVDQIDIRDAASKKSISDLMNDLSAKVGEKITLRRFTRFELGEGIEKASVDFAKEVQEAMNA